MNKTSRTFSFLLQWRSLGLNESRRCIHSHQSAGIQALSMNLRPALVVRKLRQENKAIKLLSIATAASPKYLESQPSVFSQTKEHALFLWIHLDPAADAKNCAKIMADIQFHVDAVCPASHCDESNEIVTGVGFGSHFYSTVVGSAKKDFSYKERKSPLGTLPNTGGDIFIHAKSDNMSKLFELTQHLMAQFPVGSVQRFEDVYSFIYKNGRDLSGFMEGTENPSGEHGRRTVAVEQETGGSYVLTQKWVHNMEYIARIKACQMEKFMGRTLQDSTELRDKTASCHVARILGGTAFRQKKPFQIVRQSQTFGNLHDKAGLFFIAYAASPENFNYMLDRMTGHDKDGLSDDIMRISECVSSAYWYFPGAAELLKMGGR